MAGAPPSGLWRHNPVPVPVCYAARGVRRFTLQERCSGSFAHKAQQDAELACWLQAQEQVAIARERQRPEWPEP